MFRFEIPFINLRLNKSLHSKPIPLFGGDVVCSLLSPGSAALHRGANHILPLQGSFYSQNFKCGVTQNFEPLKTKYAALIILRPVFLSEERSTATNAVEESP
ncbi:hypothetical protein CWD77_04155 [Rhodohalobacter barkolensis]|uniref:Uncharacterized protein n=1 Tax=Rhodohalobacter barkolensis TaxID=2053187 RepID=A0A2N0VKH0_9BACT|nr:hypothetical protein CWD77_04155 [Rhodohalobacter barkolensis]